MFLKKKKKTNKPQHYHTNWSPSEVERGPVHYLENCGKERIRNSSYIPYINCTSSQKVYESSLYKIIPNKWETKDKISPFHKLQVISISAAIEHQWLITSKKRKNWTLYAS